MIRNAGRKGVKAVQGFITTRKKRLVRLKHDRFDDFIFIHINKTGGSSVEKALNIPFEHKTAREKIEALGRETWDRKFTFTVIRNPWDKVVSHYHYRVKTNQTGLKGDDLDFNEWVVRAYGRQEPPYYDKPKMFMPQTDWIVDASGEIAVDDIIRFENLEEGFARVLAVLGKQASLPHAKKSNRGDYQGYYNDEARAVVAERFAQDVERFGYRF